MAQGLSEDFVDLRSGGETSEGLLRADAALGLLEGVAGAEGEAFSAEGVVGVLG